MVYAVREIKEVEVARPRPSPFGAPSPYYDVTELWFERPEALKAVAATPEWKAIVADARRHRHYRSLGSRAEALDKFQTWK
jgi:hypothetical protein